MDSQTDFSLTVILEFIKISQKISHLGNFFLAEY